VIYTRDGVTYVTNADGKDPVAIKSGHTDVKCAACDLKPEMQRRVLAGTEPWPSMGCHDPNCSGMMHRERISGPVQLPGTRHPIQLSQWFCSRCGLEGFSKPRAVPNTQKKGL
jgi:hypothetical protein